MIRPVSIARTALVSIVLAFGMLSAQAQDFPPEGTYKWKFFMPWGAGVWMSEPTRKFITEEVPTQNGRIGDRVTIVSLVLGTIKPSIETDTINKSECR